MPIDRYSWDGFPAVWLHAEELVVKKHSDYAAAKAGEIRGDRRQETGDRRQETGDRRQETGDRRQAMSVQSAKELFVYKKSYELAMRIYRISKTFPAEERYALTSQIRRSSRSVPMNLREAWAKRRYEAHFISKLTDCDGEANETDTSLEFARDCAYITGSEHSEMVSLNDEVCKMLGSMIRNPKPFLLSPAP